MTNQMQQLIEEMLDVGRFERGQVMLDRDNTVLQEVVTEAVNSYQPRASRRSVTLSTELAEHPIKVLVDEKRMVQVVTNLISSAVNHTPQDGRVNVSVKIDPNSNGKKSALVQVQDSGVGISQDMLSQVFQPFATASQGLVGGTILGLSLAKEIVELHGGEIKAENNESGSTVFTIKLPILNA
ncbi:MAG: HAMP domain-containing sensor histidine kinase [Anaerolineae bacterium]